MTVREEIRMIVFAGVLAVALVLGIKATTGQVQAATYEATITVTAQVDQPSG